MEPPNFQTFRSVIHKALESLNHPDIKTDSIIDNWTISPDVTVQVIRTPFHYLPPISPTNLTFSHWSHFQPYLFNNPSPNKLNQIVQPGKIHPQVLLTFQQAIKTIIQDNTL